MIRFKWTVLSAWILVILFSGVDISRANNTFNTIDYQDKKYNEILAKAKEHENNGDINAALNTYALSLTMERYEACSYYSMLDISRLYLSLDDYPRAIFFAKGFINGVEDELLPGSPCGFYSSSQVKDELNVKVIKAKEILSMAISKLCNELNDETMCNMIQPKE